MMKFSLPITTTTLLVLIVASAVAATNQQQQCKPAASADSMSICPTATHVVQVSHSDFICATANFMNNSAMRLSLNNNSGAANNSVSIVTVVWRNTNVPAIGVGPVQIIYGGSNDEQLLFFQGAALSVADGSLVWKTEDEAGRECFSSYSGVSLQEVPRIADVRTAVMSCTVDMVFPIWIIDRTSGKTISKINIPRWRYSGIGPVLPASGIFHAVVDDLVHAYSLPFGKKLWQANFSAYAAHRQEIRLAATPPSLQLADPIVIAHAGQQQLMGFSAATGTVVWYTSQHAVTTAVLTSIAAVPYSPASGNDASTNLVFADATGSLVVASTDNGGASAPPLWRSPFRLALLPPDIESQVLCCTGSVTFVQSEWLLFVRGANQVVVLDFSLNSTAPTVALSLPTLVSQAMIGSSDGSAFVAVQHSEGTGSKVTMLNGVRYMCDIESSAVATGGISALLNLGAHYFALFTAGSGITVYSKP